MSLDPCAVDDGMLKNCSWIEAAVKVIGGILRLKAIAGAYDKLAVVFYNTAGDKEKPTADTKHRPLSGLDNIYVEQQLEVPDIQRIRDLSDFSLEVFHRRIGVGSADSRTRYEILASALQQAGSMLPAISRNRKRRMDPRRVLICTRDVHLAASLPKSSSVAAKAKNLSDMGAVIQLMPLLNPEERRNFELSPFWDSLLQLAPPQKTESDQEIFDSESGQQSPDEEDQIFHLDNEMSVVRMKAYRKRAITRLRWSLGTGGPAIGVKLYSMLQSSWPAAKGSIIWLDGRSKKTVLSSRGLVEKSTGAVLAEENFQFSYPKAVAEGMRFPSVLATTQEVKEVKYPLPRGMTLLGTKPLSWLKPWHQLRESTFAYPDESAAKGSTRAFVALHSALLDMKAVAICMLVRSPSAMPVMVASVPQEEILDETGVQVVPPGMHLVYLPYSDDVRAPEQDVAFTGSEHPHPTEDQIAAANRVLEALHLEENFDPTSIPNPHLQRHFEVVEAVALARELPSKEIEDDSMPDADAFEKAKNIIVDFKVIVGLNEESKGVKRKAVAACQAIGDDPSKLAAHKQTVERLAAAGRLMRLTLGELRIYLKMHSLPVSGRKEVLAQRVQEYVVASNKSHAPE